MILQNTSPLRGEITVPGDKSISHRAVMFGSLAEGTTEITHFLEGADCLSTIDCFRKMGIDIDRTADRILVHGKGLHGLTAPTSHLDAGNSGTTTRLISGILAAQPFSCVLDGDDSLRSRPMGRIIKPLSMMGADLKGLKNENCLPMQINGANLKGIHYQSPVASAQVKSCVLLAGLYADAPTSVTEPVLSRNHTELMLSSFGAEITSVDTTATVTPDPHLVGQKIVVPGDISSAAYFIAAGLIVPGSEILIHDVGINPTRSGMIDAIRLMGAEPQLLNVRTVAGELTADVLVRHSSLHGAEIGGSLIPALIDELPVIAVLAAFAEGTTVIKDAAELKVKESDRIAVMTETLTALGADVTPTDDGMIINGGRALHGGKVDSHLDHRIAMSMAVAAMALGEPVEIKDADCVKISYPTFYEDMDSLKK